MSLVTSYEFFFQMKVTLQSRVRRTFPSTGNKYLEESSVLSSHLLNLFALLVPVDLWSVSDFPFSPSWLHKAKDSWVDFPRIYSSQLTVMQRRLLTNRLNSSHSWFQQNLEPPSAPFTKALLPQPRRLPGGLLTRDLASWFCFYSGCRAEVHGADTCPCVQEGNA